MATYICFLCLFVLFFCFFFCLFFFFFFLLFFVLLFVFFLSFYCLFLFIYFISFLYSVMSHSRIFHLKALMKEAHTLSSSKLLLFHIGRESWTTKHSKNYWFTDPEFWSQTVIVVKIKHLGDDSWTKPVTCIDADVSFCSKFMLILAHIHYFSYVVTKVSGNIYHRGMGPVVLQP